jgi:hypothetical protein
MIDFTMHITIHGTMPEPYDLDTVMNYGIECISDNLPGNINRKRCNVHMDKIGTWLERWGNP